MRRVVITGVGAVHSLGTRGVPRLMEGLMAGRSGCRNLLDMGAEASAELELTDAEVEALAALPSAVAAPVLGLSSAEAGLLTATERRRLPRFVRMALVAAEEAVTMAAMDLPRRPTDGSLAGDGAAGGGADALRVGAAIGVGMGSVVGTWRNADALSRRGHRRVDPFFVPRVLPNSASGAVSLRFGLRGPNHTVSTACATGAHAIGDSFNFIRTGMADAMICGGTEAVIDPLSLAGFSQLRALAAAPGGGDAGALSRPFDAARSGFVMGEGAGVLVLEERERALRRGAAVVAEVVGYGLSGDAHHPTAPRQDGSGAALAMDSALAMAAAAGVGATDVAYVNAHATSTPLGDVAEARAVGEVLGRLAGGRVAVSSVKGHLGHLLGAAGAVEAIVTAMCLAEQRAVPTLNLQELDAALAAPGAATERLDFVRGGPRPMPGALAAMSNSFGFGGTNVALVLRRGGGDA